MYPEFYVQYQPWRDQMLWSGDDDDIGDDGDNEDDNEADGDVEEDDEPRCNIIQEEIKGWAVIMLVMV